MMGPRGISGQGVLGHVRERFKVASSELLLDHVGHVYRNDLPYVPIRARSILVF